MQSTEMVQSLAEFCTFSLDSCNPKVQFTAAIVLFNLVLCFKREKKIIFPQICEALAKVNSVITDTTVIDEEALMGMLLSECRMLYQNRDTCEYVQDKLGEAFQKNHIDLKNRTQSMKVKECVMDVVSMVFKD
mmetsp:Transcript_37000/g.35718  ORF Transcript_37000/g.35718 Transcript_37000/m.35718 type:complete len:133 (-) Transcript_37000:35-433(-)